MIRQFCKVKPTRLYLPVSMNLTMTLILLWAGELSRMRKMQRNLSGPKEFSEVDVAKKATALLMPNLES